MENAKDVNDVYIFGSAEIASLAAFYFTHDTPMTVRGFVVDDEFVSEKSLEGLPIWGWSEFRKAHPVDGTRVHVALSYRGLNRLRERKFQQVKQAGYLMPSYISSKATSWPGFRYGDNCFVLEGQNLQPNVTLGDNVMLWSNNHIGHGSTIDSHAYLASEIVVSGHVRIGARTFIGVNSTIRDFVTIGHDSFIAMGASVTQDLEPGSVVLGPRSTILDAKDDKALRIRRSAFGESAPHF